MSFRKLSVWRNSMWECGLVSCRHGNQHFDSLIVRNILTSWVNSSKLLIFSVAHSVWVYIWMFPSCFEKNYMHQCLFIYLSVIRWFIVRNLFPFIKFGMLGFDFDFLLFILRSTVCGCKWTSTCVVSPLTNFDESLLCLCYKSIIMTKFCVLWFILKSVLIV